MKEIVGYGMIEPDGSVMTKIPANTALMISVLDANGKRITQRAQQLDFRPARPGHRMQRLSRTGDGSSRTAAGTPSMSAWAGAAVAGASFPNANPALVRRRRWRHDGESSGQHHLRNDDCSSIEPSMDVEFTDDWTIPPNPGDPVRCSRALHSVMHMPTCDDPHRRRWRACRTGSRLPHDHQLRDAYSSALEPAATRVRRIGQSGTRCEWESAQQQLPEVSHTAGPGGRYDRACTGRAARTPGRSFPGRAGAFSRLSRIASY